MLFCLQLCAEGLHVNNERTSRRKYPDLVLFTSETTGIQLKIKTLNRPRVSTHFHVPESNKRGGK